MSEGRGRELRVCEIFRSLQGEASRAGLPCTLVRLAGCNLRCRWCDTPYAQDLRQGRRMEIGEILRRIRQLGGNRVELTGGEPLLQPAAIDLLAAICDAGHETLLETNGSQDLSPIDPRVVRIIDRKCPSSGAAESFRPEILEQLRPRDELKFVLADRADFLFAVEQVRREGLEGRSGLIFSPVAGELPPALLAEWLLESGLQEVRLGLQLHRILWPDRSRGV